MNEKSTKEMAEEFAGCPVWHVGEQLGTRYADGGIDRDEYFEAENGQHIVVSYYYISDEFSVYHSDGVVW